MHFIGADQLHGFRKRLTSDIVPADFIWACYDLDENGERKVPRGAYYRRYKTPDVGPRVTSINMRYDEETHFRALQYLALRGEIPEDPFLLLVSYHHPHEPFYAPREFWDMYEGEEIEIPEYPENLEETYSTMDKWLNRWHGVDSGDIKEPDSLRALRRAYYAAVSYVDRKVGELVYSLEQNGLLENTIIVFTSDHGDMLGERGMVQKRSFYEWSTRIPLIIRFPDGMGRGTKIKEPVSLIDVTPTVLDMAGIKEAVRCPVDGKSLMGLISGDAEPDRDVFSEHHTEAVESPCFMIRRGSYKYIMIHGHESLLFDLEQDPGEWNNLSGREDLGEKEYDLRQRILEQFDPDEINRGIIVGMKRKKVIRDAMIANDTHWDYSPVFEPTLLYVRQKKGQS